LKRPLDRLDKDAGRRKILLREVLETQEDIYLAQIADRRASNWEEPLGLSHEENWS
jgi:hypothetical protein